MTLLRRLSTAGGVAKKLCPSGFRCELSSFEDNATGICVDASMPPQDISGFLVEARREILRQEARDDESAREDSEEFVTVTIQIAGPNTDANVFSYSFAIPSSWWWEEKRRNRTCFSGCDCGRRNY
jgi:hypothetical protein